MLDSLFSSGFVSWVVLGAAIGLVIKLFSKKRISSQHKHYPKLPRSRTKNETMEDIAAEMSAYVAYDKVYERTRKRKAATRVFWDVYNRRHRSQDELDAEKRSDSAYIVVYNRTHDENAATEAYWENFYRRYR